MLVGFQKSSISLTAIVKINGSDDGVPIMRLRERLLFSGHTFAYEDL